MKRKIYIYIIGVCLFLLAGCGSDPELSGFRDQMDSFYESLSAAVNTLESIDPDSASVTDEILAGLDEMSVLFDELAEIEVPPKFEENFGNIEELADQASQYMSEADSLYHEAFADGGYDDALAQAAHENYTRAMKRVNYIAILLQGRIPEDDNITVITEENEPDWNGGETPVPQTGVSEE